MTGSDSELANRNYTVKIGDYLSRGWDIFKEFAWAFVLFTLLLAVIGFMLSLLPAPIGSNAEGQGGLANAIVSPVLGAGFYIVALGIMKGRSYSFSDFFQGFQNFLPIFLVSLVGSLITALGLVLLLIPGIYIGVCYLFGMCFVIEKRLDFWDALEASRKIVTREWFSMFGFVLVLVLLNVGGALLCGLGLLVTIPWSACAVAAAFEDIVGLNQSDTIADSSI